VSGDIEHLQELLYVELVRKKRMTKSLFPTETLSASSFILVFYPEGAAGHICLSLNTSHSFLNFGETVGFHPFSLAISFYIIAISEF